jgi:hypothetical protein
VTPGVNYQKTMRKYQAYINGDNFLMMNQGNKEQMGFYATRWVEALSPKEAEIKAIELIMNDQDLIGAIHNKDNDPPKLFVEEIAELDSFEGVNPPGSGYTFYPVEEKSN